MSTLQNRNERLADISKMIIDGNIVHKLDNIATIFINNKFYFNVFRRYNSPYNIVIEDYNLDIYLHQDYTVRTSLKNILCLPEYEASNIYTWAATSYKHNGPIPISDKDIVDMRWSEIHGLYQAINVNFEGIFDNIQYVFNDDLKDEVPSTPRNQMIPELTCPPDAPSRPTITKEDREAAHTLLTLSIPVYNNECIMSESDGPTLSMRFADVMKRKSYNEESYMDQEDDDIKEANYIVLRNGSMIPKVICT